MRGGPIRAVALNHSSLAFLVARTKTDCEHVELWDTGTQGTWRFGKPGPCTNLGSTGNGISGVGVSGNRLLWIRYAGGNIRDWQLMTATTTKRTPKLLRTVSQDVDLSSPFVIGDSTRGDGIPYAAGNEVVLLGNNGGAIFKSTQPAKVVAVTSGRGPGGAVVAALLETGQVVLLKSDGSTAATVVYQPGAVKAIALAPVGLIVQLLGGVQIRHGSASATVNLPSGAVMSDYAEGRILYTRRNEVHALRIVGGKDTLLLKAAPGRPVFPTLDTHGLGWARGFTVNFACGGCVTYAPRGAGR